MWTLDKINQDGVNNMAALILILLGAALSSGVTKYNEQPVGLLDKNIAEYQCSGSGGLEEVTPVKTTCYDGTKFTKN